METQGQKEAVPTIDPNSIQRALLEKRMVDLQKEFENGQEVLRKLAADTGSVEKTVLRIAGAIQVLAELLEKVEDNAQAAEPAEKMKMKRDQHKKGSAAA